MAEQERERGREERRNKQERKDTQTMRGFFLN